MQNALSTLCMILMILLMFTLIVVSHEWGHYITAKKTGVLVHEFAVGMGPILWSKQKGETLYSLRLFPIGGFCRMEGEDGESTNPRAMSARKPWQKFIILVAGATMNFIVAWVLLSILAGFGGESTNIIKEVQTQSPAAQAGMQAGDEITAINGKTVKNLKEIRMQIADEPQSYELTINRKGTTLQFTVTTKQQAEGEKPCFGFIAKVKHPNLFEDIKQGFLMMIQLIVMVWKSLLELITGKLAFKEMAGFVGVVDASNQVWQSGIQNGGILGAVLNMLSMTALLSANLGVVNLLPLPALDGGRIFFVLIEMIRGKAVPAEKEGVVHFIGMVLLMLLTIVVLYNDVMRLIK